MKLSLFPIVVAIAAAGSLQAAEPEAVSAGDLAGRLSAKQQDGTSVVRLKMETEGNTLQLQIKSRATRGGTDLVYQVLWPKERKGESVLLRRSGGRAASGTYFSPPDSLRPLSAAQMDEPLFGSALSYEDVIENFFAWDRQAIVGAETVDRVPCQILESKPGKGERSSYSSVRSWIDTRRMVPLRIEKYSGSGKLTRRIDATRIASDDQDRAIPANLTIQGGGKTTMLDGSRIRHGVALTDAEFTPEGIKQTTVAKGSQE